MSESSEAWVVTRGSYSDYRVLCVVDSRKRAKKIAKLLSGDCGDECRVEVLPYLNRDPVRVNVLGLSEELMDDGSTYEAKEISRSEWEMDMTYPEFNRPVYWRWVRAPYLTGKSIWVKQRGSEGGRLEVHGTDHERARKVFSEKRAEILMCEPLRHRKEAHS